MKLLKRCLCLHLSNHSLALAHHAVGICQERLFLAVCFPSSIGINSKDSSVIGLQVYITADIMALTQEAVPLELFGNGNLSKHGLLEGWLRNPKSDVGLRKGH